MPNIDSKMPQGEVDWAALVQRIQKRMYLSQKEIAERCGVARQTVSAWLHRRRKPGLYAKRELIVLAAEAGVLDSRAVPDAHAGRPQASPSSHLPRPAALDRRSPDSIDAQQLRILLDQLSEAGREEVLEFARFKIFRERG